MDKNAATRRWNRFLGLAAGLLIAAAAVPGWAAEQMPGTEEMWRIIQTQQKQIEELIRLVKGGQLQPAARSAAPASASPPAEPAAAAPAPAGEIESLKARVEALDAKVEATGQMVKETRRDEGEAASALDKVHLGGYGELHYNAGEKDEIDFHRFVLFFGYDFADWIRFASEVEFEHALIGEGEPGEVELEQAFVEFDLPRMQRTRAGVLLVPVGILNETHEPPTFFGVERNPVETNIVPTTWWEGGAALGGPIAEGFSYDLFVSSGLEVPTAGSSAFKVRNGRKKVAEAPAEDGAFTGRIKWTGLPGVELGFTGHYQEDVVQSASAGAPATLFETHADIRRGPWGLRALWARWDLHGRPAELLGRDVQEGWYVEPSYRFDIGMGELGFFGRYNEWDNEAGDDRDSAHRQWDVGFNFWPHPDVVIKADYQSQDLPAGVDDDDRINLGLGYQF